MLANVIPLLKKHHITFWHRRHKHRECCYPAPNSRLETWNVVFRSMSQKMLEDERERDQRKAVTSRINTVLRSKSCKLELGSAYLTGNQVWNYAWKICFLLSVFITRVGPTEITSFFDFVSISSCPWRSATSSSSFFFPFNADWAANSASSSYRNTRNFSALMKTFTICAQKKKNN